MPQVREVFNDRCASALSAKPRFPGNRNVNRLLSSSVSLGRWKKFCFRKNKGKIGSVSVKMGVKSVLFP